MGDPALRSMTLNPRGLAAAVLLGATFAVAPGCDTAITGDGNAAAPPDTELAVQDSSLVDNICGDEPVGQPCDPEDNLLTSTVFVSWSGSDPDGYVAAYELRYYDADVAAPEGGWSRTERRDSLLLFPLSSAIDRVAFEVRAIDNEGLVDPTPARTVFPIRNSRPDIALNSLELPPDTTWPVFSFAWEADDPEGPDDVQRVEVRFNDAPSWVSLPQGATFATFVATDPRQTGGDLDMEVYLGRSFQRAGITVPGVRPDADNVFYVRAVDRAGEASPADTLAWFVRQPHSDVLLVNDYRSARDGNVLPFHRRALAGYLGGDGYDEWDLSGPDDVTAYADAFPASPDPTLRATLRLWDYIYWVSTNATDQTLGRNLVLAAELMDDFVDGGGRLFVNVPVRLPVDPAANVNNAALSLLPLDDFVEIDREEYEPALDLFRGAPVRGTGAIPGTGRVLPDLEAVRIVSGALPYVVDGGANVGLYDATFTVQNAAGDFVTWPGESNVASISADGRVGLMALPFVSELRGEPRFAGADGDPDAPRTAVQYLLEGLGFPGTPED